MTEEKIKTYTFTEEELKNKCSVAFAVAANHLANMSEERDEEAVKGFFNNTINSMVRVFIN
jgi:hypothetical protein